MPAFLPPIIPPGRIGANLAVTAQQVATGYERRQFVGVAYRLYRGDPRWIPPFKAARKDALRSDRNPLLRDAELSAFLGIAQNMGFGDENVATLAAWTSPEEPEEEEGAWGSWGLFEAINVVDLPDRLFYEAENWLFENAAGLTGIRGPMSVEPLVPPGLLTDGFDARPPAFVPYNPPYYPEMIEGQGYERASAWRVYRLDLPASPPSEGRNAGLPPAAPETWRDVSRAYATHAVADAAGVLIPGMTQWLAHLAGATPFSYSGSWVRAVGRSFCRALIWARLDENEEPAVCFGVPDIGDGLRMSRGRELPLGWLLFEIGLRRTRRLRVFPAAAPESWDADQLGELYAAVARAAAPVGYRQMDIAPIADDDERSTGALLALGARPAQQFTIYEKTF